MYRRSSAKILAGGLNYLPPGNKVPEGDSLVLQNFRVDQAGQLRSRRGLYSQAGPYAGATIHSLYRWGLNRFAGVGQYLRLGPSLGTLADSGYDGNPLSIIAYQNYAWVMNRARQSKVQGGTGTRFNWGIVAPTAAPSVAAGSANTVAVVEFQANDDTNPWEVFSFEGGGVVNGHSPVFDASEKVSGTHSLHIACDTIGKWRAAIEFFSSSKDLRIEGQDRDDDEMRIWFYVTEPSRIVNISIGLFSASSEPRGNVTAIVSPTLLNQMSGTWTQIVIQRRQDAAALTGADETYQTLWGQLNDAITQQNTELEAQLRAQLQTRWDYLLAVHPHFRESPGTAFDWSAVTGIAVEVEVNDACDIRWDVASMWGGPSASLSGEFVFFYTFANDDGHESNGSPESAVLTLKKQKAALTNVAVSTDAQVTKRHIYAVGSNIQEPLRIGTIGNNTGTSFTWQTTIEEAQNNNIPMPVDAEPAPPCRSACFYNGRVIAMSSSAHPSRYWYTPVARPWEWPGADDDFEGNWEDVGDDSDELLAAVPHKNQIWWYKLKSIWRTIGDVDAASPEQSNAGIGLVGVKALCSDGAVDYFVGWNGIYLFDGDRERWISQKIDPLFKGDYVELGGTWATPIAQDYISDCCLEFHSNRLFFSYPEDGKTTNSATLVYDPSTGNWTMYRAAAALTQQGFSRIYNEGATGALLAALNTSGGAKLYELESSLTDDSQPIPLLWRSRFYDQGLPENLKTYADVVIDYQTGIGAETPCTLTIKAVYDNGTIEAVGSLNSGTRTGGTVFPLGSDNKGRKGKNFAIQIEGDCTASVLIFSVELHWYVEERQGKTFDTGIIDFGSPYCKQVDRFQLEITPTTQVNATISSDQPEDTLTSHAIPQIAAASRCIRPLVLGPTYQDGYLHRLQLVAAGGTPQPFQLHSLKAYIRQIPIYLRAGQFWLSSEVVIGDGRLGQIRDLTLDYEAGVAGSLELYSGMQGTAMSLADSATLPVASRWSQTFPLEAEGAMAQLKISAGGLTRIWGGSLRWKQIGVWFDGSKGNTWETEALNLGLPSLVRELEFDLDTTGGITYTLESELPEQDLRDRATGSINTESTTGGRRTWNIRVPGSTRGTLLRLFLTGAAQVKLYGVRAYVRPLGVHDAAPWRWISFPVVGTAAEWTVAPLPLPAVNSNWQWVDLPVDAIE